MPMNSGFAQALGERKKLSFGKTFECADLSSECMRAFPYDLIRSIPEKDLSDKMVIRAKWGSTWEVDISRNPRFYYMEKRGWDQFVRDNALGKGEFITFTHTGKMCFNVNIYENNFTEILIPRIPPTMLDTSGIKKEKGEEGSGNKRKVEEPKTSKKKQKKQKEITIPEFKITIKNTYLFNLAIPKKFVNDHIPNESKTFKIHHSEGHGSWKVLCLAREAQTRFSRGWRKLVTEYPLLVGDRCTFKLVKPTEFLLSISK